MEEKKICKAAKKCGGCNYQGMTYEEQLATKQKQVSILLKKFGKLEPIIGMENPYYYRNKVHSVFDRDRKGNVICGNYEARTHKVVPIEECLIEDKKCQEIIRAIRDMLKSFKIKTYDEDTGYGLLRHVLVRRAFATGEIMVVLVIGSPVFPSKNNFVKALRKQFPEISTVILNINDKKTSMVLGERDIVIYGKGFIRDTLCGCTFRISPQSFYQVNPVQTEILYGKAMEFAGLTGKERVIDAYCGIGTIGLVAAKHAREVIGIELNKDAVRDAKVNARENKITNARFYQGDAGQFMEAMAAKGEHADLVFMDPPRSGSDRKFMSSVITLNPAKIVYISCGQFMEAMAAKGEHADLVFMDPPRSGSDRKFMSSVITLNPAKIVYISCGPDMEAMAAKGEHADLVFMDPPRSGSDRKFMSSVITLNPAKIVYISCGPDTLARDLEYLTKHGYEVKKMQAVDMFGFTEHVETVVLLCRK